MSFSEISEGFTEIPDSDRSRAGRLAIRGLRFAISQYHASADYLRQNGLQTSNDAYGGSRSFVYYEMLGRAPTLSGMWKAHREYKSCHKSNEANHDVYGAFLRIAAYRLRNVPVINSLINQAVQRDDSVMAGADFDYPADVPIIIRPLGMTIDNNSPSDMKTDPEGSVLPDAS